MKRDEEALSKLAKKYTVVLLKLDSCESWFADASINGICFKFLIYVNSIINSTKVMQYKNEIPNCKWRGNKFHASNTGIFPNIRKQV